VQLQAPLYRTESPNQPLTGRATVCVVLGIVAKMSLAKPTLCRGVGGEGFWNDGRDSGAMTVEYLFTFEIAPVGNHGQVFWAYRRSRLPRQGRQLIKVSSDLDHLMRYYQVALGIYGGLDVITSLAFTPRLQGSGLGVSAGNLFIRRFIKLNFEGLEGFHWLV
jgi:hypothetical protein